MSGQETQKRLWSALYCIVQTDAGWSIQLNRKPIVTCASYELAIKAAIHSAFKAHRLGYRARVVMHDGQSLRTLWSNGRLPSEPLHRLAICPQLRKRSDPRVGAWRPFSSFWPWTGMGQAQTA